MQRAVLIKSCNQFRARAEACNETWANVLRRKGVIVYVVRDGQIPSINTQGGFINTTVGDAYSANSMKVKDALAMMLLMHKEVRRVFICDDDTWVSPWRWLEHEPEGEFECRLYHPTSDKDHKLNYGRPWANGGAGWWMSRRLCKEYVNKVKTACSWDDVIATSIAQDLNVQISDRPDLYGDKRYSDSGPGHITSHPVQPAGMSVMFAHSAGESIAH